MVESRHKAAAVREHYRCRERAFYLGLVGLFSLCTLRYVALRRRHRSMRVAMSEPAMLISKFGTTQHRTWKTTTIRLPPFIDIEQPERQALGAQLQYIYKRRHSRAMALTLTRMIAQTIITYQ